MDFTTAQIQDFRAKILEAIKNSPNVLDGWCKGTTLGNIIKMEAHIDYTSMGYKMPSFVKLVFGMDLERRGIPPQHEYRVCFESSDVENGVSSNINLDNCRFDTPRKIAAIRESAYTRLLKFAFFPRPQAYDGNGFEWTIKKLAEKANKEERWYYGETDPGNYPILRNYFLMTFERLQSEDLENQNNPNWDKRLKVVNNSEKIFGVPKYDKVSNTRTLYYPNNILLFNTGLVDDLYEAVYAVFYTNTYGDAPWRFHKFISGSGEDKEHMFLAKLYGDKFPLPAKYYDSTLQLVYDITKPIASYNWGHIIDRCNRLPIEFLEDNCAKEVQDSRTTEGLIDYKLLSRNIKNNTRLHRLIQNRIKDAVEHALKRVEWNFKTAIPIYYPGKKDISLLLPLSLMGESNKIDAALVLESDATAYIAHTILKLNMAYANARLITRPDSDWLTPASITISSDVDIDSDE